MLLLHNNNNAHFCSQMHWLKILQIKEPYSYAIESFDNKSQLTITKKVVRILRQILLKRKVRKWHSSMSTRP